MGMSSEIVASLPQICDSTIASCPDSYFDETLPEDSVACYPPSENKPSPVFQSFPQGTQKFGPELAREVTEGLSRELITSLKNFQFDQGGASKLVQLFSDNFDTTFQATLVLNETDIPITGPDISLAAGAKVYLEGKTEQGRLSLTRPILLEGVSVFGFNIREIFLDGHGKIEAQFAALPVEKDITSRIMGTAFGKLFPDKKVGSVLPQKLLELAFGGDPFLSRGRDALKRVFLNLQVLNKQGIETDNECVSPLLASAHVALDIPLIKENRATHAYENFDMKGVGAHSGVSWAQFPLALLPLPDGIDHLEGVADVFWNYEPQTGVTTISVKNMDARMLASSWFGEEPVSARGGLTLKLKAGGGIDADFSNFVFDLPVFPTVDKPLASVSGMMNGHMEMQSSNSVLFLQEAHLSVKDFKGVSKKGTGLRVTDQSALAGAVAGDFFVDFSSMHSEAPLKTRWDMKGNFVGEAEGHPLQYQNAVFTGNGGWREARDGYYPDVRDFKATAIGDLAVKNKNGWVKARHAWFNMDQDRRLGPLISAAKIQMGSDKITVGGFTFSPLIDVYLQNRWVDDSYVIEGAGTWSARSFSPVVELGADFTFSADLDNYSWQAAFTHDQIFGNLTAVGAMNVIGHGPMPYSSRTNSWEATTVHPYQLKLRNQTLAEGIRVTGTGGGDGQEFSLDADSILDIFSAQAYVRSPPGSSLLSGRYVVRGNRPLEHQGFIVEEALFEGTLSNGSLAKAAVNVTGTGTGRLTGALEGPASINYAGLLRFAPAAGGNHQMILELDNPSSLSAGPLLWDEENMAFTANGGLHGTLALNAGRHALGLTGHDVGFANAEVRVERPGSADTPFLKDFSITVPNLRGIHDGVAYGGDEGIRVEGLLYPEALPYGISRGSPPHRLYSVIDQLYLNKGTYWGNIRNFIRQFKKPEEKKP